MPTSSRLMKWLFPLLLVIFLAVPSARAIWKFVPRSQLVLPLYIGTCGCLYWLFLRHRTGLGTRYGNWISSPLLSYLLVALYGVCTFLIYPVADARKEAGLGSTADDALIQPALSFFKGAGLYSARLYDGAPISPGPGWILINTPFALLDVYWMLPICYILACVTISIVLLRKPVVVNIALLLMSTSLVFWELLVSGHDIVPIGFTFVSIILLGHRLSGAVSRKGLIRLSILSLFTGLFATSRIVFICVPLLLSLFMWKRSRRNALMFLGISTIVCTILHGYFYFRSDYYQPFHLFGRGHEQVGLPLIVSGLLATLGVVALAYHKLNDSPENWIVSFFTCLSLPLALISLGELVTVEYSFASWEGANYLVPAAPLLSLAAASRIAGTGSA